MIETAVEFFLIFGLICDTRHIDGDNADRSGALAGTEESAGFLSKLTQIQAETAAHGAHVAWFHIAVDVVGEVRGTVFCSHFEQQTVILRIGPVKIGCDGVGRDRVLEASSVGISLDHRLDERFVDHIHLFLQSLYLKSISLPPTIAGSSARSSGTVQSSVMLENGAWLPQRLGVLTP